MTTSLPMQLHANAVVHMRLMGVKEDLTLLSVWGLWLGGCQAIHPPHVMPHVSHVRCGVPKQTTNKEHSKRVNCFRQAAVAPTPAVHP